MKNIAWKQLEDKVEGLVEIRRNLHMYPELTFEEIKTPTMFEIRIKGRGDYGSMRRNLRLVQTLNDGDYTLLRGDFYVYFQKRIAGSKHKRNSSTHGR
ncbi:MAG: hypothetical protein WAM95_04565 [Bacillus sp. (in: firmicutes)]